MEQNRSKLLKFPSEPFSGRRNNSEFHSVNKNRSKLSEFHSKPFRGRVNISKQTAAAKNFAEFCLFCSELLNWLFRGTRNASNEHFLPWNRGDRSKSIPQNFAERNSVPNPTVRTHRGACLTIFLFWNLCLTFHHNADIT